LLVLLLLLVRMNMWLMGGGMFVGIFNIF